MEYFFIESRFQIVSKQKCGWRLIGGWREALVGGSSQVSGMEDGQDNASTLTEDQGNQTINHQIKIFHF